MNERERHIGRWPDEEPTAVERKLPRQEERRFACSGAGCWAPVSEPGTRCPACASSTDGDGAK